MDETGKGGDGENIAMDNIGDWERGRGRKSLTDRQTDRKQRGGGGR